MDKIGYIKREQYAAFALPAGIYDGIAAILRAREYHHIFDTENGAIIMDGIAFTRTPAVNPPMPVSRQVHDNMLRAWWRSIGGAFHGPNVETATIPEDRLLEILRLDGWPTVEKGWLIENGKTGVELRYYQMTRNHGWTWTEKIDDAMRFARFKDADDMIGVNANGWVAREHQWA